MAKRKRRRKSGGGLAARVAKVEAQFHKQVARLEKAANRKKAALSKPLRRQLKSAQVRVRVLESALADLLGDASASLKRAARQPRGRGKAKARKGKGVASLGPKYQKTAADILGKVNDKPYTAADIGRKAGLSASASDKQKSLKCLNALREDGKVVGVNTDGSKAKDRARFWRLP